MDFELGEMNPKAAGLALIGGAFAFLMAKSMYPKPGIGKMIILFGAFALTTAACYFLISRMADN